MTEAQLVALAREGDQDAFAQLVRDNENRIYTLTLRMTGSREDALDLAQEAFLNAWRGLKHFQGDSSFSTWLYRLASNACIDHLRRRTRRQEVDGALSLDDEDAPVRPQAAPDSDPQAELERRELRRAVRRGLDELNPQQRQVLVMRELSGLSYQEIAEVLLVDLGTVKSRIARARLALREVLRREGNFFAPPSSIPAETTGKE